MVSGPFGPLKESQYPRNPVLFVEYTEASNLVVAADHTHCSSRKGLHPVRTNTGRSLYPCFRHRTCDFRICADAWSLGDLDCSVFGQGPKQSPPVLMELSTVDRPGPQPKPLEGVAHAPAKTVRMSILEAPKDDLGCDTARNAGPNVVPQRLRAADNEGFAKPGTTCFIEGGPVGRPASVGKAVLRRQRSQPLKELSEIIL